MMDLEGRKLAKSRPKGKPSPYPILELWIKASSATGSQGAALAALDVIQRIIRPVDAEAADFMEQRFRKYREFDSPNMFTALDCSLPQYIHEQAPPAVFGMVVGYLLSHPELHMQLSV